MIIAGLFIFATTLLIGQDADQSLTADLKNFDTEQSVTQLIPLWDKFSEAFLDKLINNELETRTIAPTSIRGKIALRFTRTICKQFDARPVTTHEAPAYHAIVDTLCAKLSIEKPIICLSSSFDNACARSMPGIPKIIIFGTKFAHNLNLNDAECEAVLAHELGHIARSHFPKLVAIGTVSQLAAIVISHYTGTLINKKYTPTGATQTPLLLPKEAYRDLFLHALGTAALNLTNILFFMKISRMQEYEADALAANIVESPGSMQNMLSALEKKLFASPSGEQFLSLMQRAVDPKTSSASRALSQLQIWAITSLLTHPLPEERKAALIRTHPL